MTWQPIATAPTDRIILLYRPTASYPAIRIAPGKFDHDKYAKKTKTLLGNLAKNLEREI